MYVCICHSVTDRQIHEAVADGASTLGDLRRGLNLGGTCGKCVPCAREVLAEARCEHRGEDRATLTGFAPAFG